MTITQILDSTLPLTKEDMRCGMRKAKKLRARAELVISINKYLNGFQITLPGNVLTLLNDTQRAG